MSSNVLFAFVVMLAASAIAAPAEEASPKTKRGLLGGVALAHAPIVAPFAYSHAPIAAYGYGLHAPLAAYHAPIAAFGYHAPIFSSYHNHLW